ncbi:serine/threonine/tyrosine-interacting-like protein 1 isoform X2 [Protopterus annectens]|uniref:serine/threonine/tyrosine-interacting-like protein 1 isoform X2 n=1 Tax=Protopterus annectens TaxID=7888 RepID=UPI001CF9B291|nr:serine/threonine/tyrosine-interacting-like protein 1 isoform X2 [Protopterus annectens]
MTVSMAGLMLCDPSELYNILNQATTFSRLTDTNYLCLLDARKKSEYDESHVITAKRAKEDENGEYLVPPAVELECLRYCIVYDGHTDSLSGDGPAIRCAIVLEEISRNPIRILKGGYEVFSAYYPFFRTQTIMYTPLEMDALQPYPVEILRAQLYMGNFRQANDPHIQKDLKIKAHVNVCTDIANIFKDHETGQLLHISVEDSGECDLLSFFPEACNFIELHNEKQSTVLVFSTLGISRSSTIAMAYLMYKKQYTLQYAWKYMRKCKMNIRPNRGFVEQLSKWEERIIGTKTTDISDPNF